MQAKTNTRPSRSPQQDADMKKVFKKYSKKMIEEEKESELDREIRHLVGCLPVYARKDKIIETIKTNQVCVVQGETGYASTHLSFFVFLTLLLFFLSLPLFHFLSFFRSGKSTQLPQYLVEAGLNYVVRNGRTTRLKIAVTQPRRNAVSAPLFSLSLSLPFCFFPTLSFYIPSPPLLIFTR